MRHKGEPLLIVDFGPNGGKKVFPAKQELRSFIDAVNDTPIVTQLRSRFGNSTISNFDAARQAISDLEQGQVEVSAVREALLDAFTDRRAMPVPVLENPDAQFLISVAERFPEAVFLGALAFHFRNPGAMGDSSDIRTGQMLAIAHENGIGALDVADFKRAFGRLKAEGTKLQARYAADASELLAEAEARNSRLRLRATKFFARVARNRLKVSRRLEQQQKDAIADLQQTEQTYRTQLGLQAPVEYWKLKAEKHASNSIKLRQVAAIYAVCAVAVAIIVLLLTAEALRSHTQFSPSTIAYGTLGLLVTTVALWGGRILVRLYMSEHHLAIDAEERATMVHTFLALQLAGQVEAKDLQLVLGPIFRPSADGIVKDDGAPEIGLAALISKAGAKPA